MSRRNLRLPSLLSLLLWLLVTTTVFAQQSRPVVYVAHLQGVINPVTATYVQRALAEASQANASALVIEMDTPGGLMDSMREITGAILNSRVPVVVYVAPQGARAASAGVFVTQAAHVAAMAPNTNVGSAHPVDGQGEQLDPTMADKVVNDAVAQIKDVAQRRGRNADWVEKAVRESVNATSTEAYNLKVVDLLADNRTSLLNAIDGRSVILADGRTVTLATKGAEQVPVDMNPVESFLHVITDPTIAYLMLSLGGLALAFELTSPGAVLPGVAGVLLVLIALYALGTLPVNLAGVLLVLLGFALMVGEVLIVPGHGVMAVGGVIALVMGSLLLMQSSSPFLAVSPYAVAAVVIISAAFFFIAIRGVVRTYRRRPTTGIDGLIGAFGEARTELNPSGMVFVQGELWEATSEGSPVPQGAEVRVLRAVGLHLVVAESKGRYEGS